MSKQNKNEFKVDDHQINRLEDAKNNLSEIQKKLKPYIKKKEYKDYSTSGKWCETSSLCR